MKELKKVSYKDFIMLAILLAKITCFYLLIGFTKSSIIIGSITFLFFVVIFVSYLFSNSKHCNRSFLIVYSLLTLLMFADCLYYSYFNQLPSVNQVAQMNNLIVVDESIKFTTPPISILLFIDIPIYYIYFKKKRAQITGDDTIKFKPYKKVLTSLLLGLLLLMSWNPMNADAIKAVSNTEFLTYHINDIYTKVFGYKDNQIKSNENVEKVIDELQNNRPLDKKYLGVAKDKNLIVIQVESLQDFPINAYYEGQELTPNLNKLIKGDSLYFENYYQNIGRGNTSDAEFSTQNSIYPVIDGECYRLYQDNTFYGLPWIMRENGYSTKVFHGYEGSFWNREAAYPNQGFEDYVSLEDMELDEKIGFGLSDVSMFEQATERIEKMEKPFYSFLITLSCHHPYILPDKYNTIQLNSEDEGTVFGNYLQGVHYSDMAIGKFIEILKEKGLYDDTIIAIYGDHHGLNCKDASNYECMTRYLGKEYDYNEMLNIPLIINIPGSGINETISTVGGQVDFLPTITNLLGVPIKNKYILGQDLVNAKKGYVASVTYMLRGSFITDDVIFEMSRESLFSTSTAKDLETNEVIEDNTYLEDYYNRALQLLDTSKYILENNLITR
ncbi:LTA synthase family protein [Vallitalea guaymasensis]|uniref:LTA synthase family protein n=1 Tax=Vallitalea guaymasensis TaxID=1185412 RepID=A0A8J8M9L6_9FIRM|nr:LTA synthase family protein [Vallitalea guaymasensis]QUH28859.1 LTA synthase family protein [Vallitalea guaymasensis]